MKISTAFLLISISSMAYSQQFKGTMEFRGIFGDSVILLTLTPRVLVNGDTTDTTEYFSDILFVPHFVFDSAKHSTKGDQLLRKYVTKREIKGISSFSEASMISPGLFSISFWDLTGSIKAYSNDTILRIVLQQTSKDSFIAQIRIRNSVPESSLFIKDSMTMEDRIRQYMRAFQTAILNNDRKKVIEMAGNSNVYVGKKKIKSVAEFSKKYDKIFTPEFINRIRNFTVDGPLWEHDGYYEFGGEQGDFWIGAGGLFLDDLNLWVNTINGNNF